MRSVMWFLAVLVAVILGGCSDEQTTTSNNVIRTIEGFISDGPLLENTVVTAYPEDESLVQTGTSFKTYTDEYGAYQMDAPLGITQISARGRYWLDVLGGMSQGELELACLMKFEERTDLANCNIFGQSIRTRIEELVTADGLPFADAETQAENEFRIAMEAVGVYHPDKTNAKRAFEIDVVRGPEADKAWLLTVAGAFTQVCLNEDSDPAVLPGCIQVWVGTVTNDLREDGLLKESSVVKLREAVRVLDAGSVVSSSQQYIDVFGLRDEQGNPLVAPSIAMVLDTDGDGVVNGEEDDADGDGVMDTEDCDPTSAGQWSDIATGRYTLYGVGKSGALSNIGKEELPMFGDSRGQMYKGTDADWASVSSGDEGLYACALKTNATLWCWGQSGVGYIPCSADEQAAPCQVGTDADWSAVSAGGNYACATKTNGTLWCWGKSATDGTAIAPTQVAGTFTSASAGGNWACGVTGGKLLCWFAGQEAAPTQVGTDADWTSGDASGFDTSDFFCDWPPPSGERSNCRDFAPSAGWYFGIRSGDGSLNYVEARSDTLTFTAPIQIQSGSVYTEVSASGVEADHRHVCGLTADNKIYCWNGLIDGPPTEVATTCGKWAKLAVSRSYQCGLKTDGTIWCWDEATMAETLTDPTVIQAAPSHP